MTVEGVAERLEEHALALKIKGRAASAEDLRQAATLLRRQAEALQAAESRATKAEGELEKVKGALRETLAMAELYVPMNLRAPGFQRARAALNGETDNV